jgi:signal transduction histidine kinase
MPLVFSGEAIGVLWLDNVWSGYKAWEKQEEKTRLLEFCRTVVEPTLVFDHFAEPLVQRHAESLPHDLHQGVYLVDSSAVIRQSNLAFREMVGGDSRGRNILELESVTGTEMESDLRLAFAGNVVERFRFPFLTVFGRRLEFDYRLAPLQLFGEKSLGVVGMFVDSRAARGASMRMTAALVLGRLHSVSGWIRELRDSLDQFAAYAGAGSSFPAGAVSKMAAARSNLCDLLEQLVAISRASVGMSIEDVDIQRLLHRLAARTRSLGEFTVHTDGSAPVVRSSADLLEIVFDNLLMNAYRATRNTSNPEVRIGVETLATDNGKTRLLVTFRDTGPGISPEVRNAVAPTSPIAVTAKRAGLGLAIAREIVEFLGGCLTVPESGAGEVSIEVMTFLAK